jgi:hypothetical protein
MYTSSKRTSDVAHIFIETPGSVGSGMEKNPEPVISEQDLDPYGTRYLLSKIKRHSG